MLSERFIHPDIRRRLEAVRSLIDERYAEPLPLRLLADEAAVSQFHFLRLFRRTFGTTPNRYLQNVRIDRAKDLLIFTDRSVTEICFDVGFSALGSFSRLFCRRVGTSPIDYRERFRAENLSSVPFCYVSMRTVTTRDVQKAARASAEASGSDDRPKK